MPRVARKKSVNGIYHIMLRGINKQTVFEDEEDHEKFLQVLKECREISGFKIMAYCLMGNHLHLLIKEELEPIELIFKRIGVRYVYWYNLKYKRSGHLFQDRFKSEPVDNDGYFLTVLRYIHQNPVKAGLCKAASEYKWSSYNDYLIESSITDTDFALHIFTDDKEAAMRLFEKHMKEDEKIECLDLGRDKRLTDSQAKEIIKLQCGTQNSTEFQKLSQENRDRNLSLLRKNGLSIRQISRLTGISFGIVRK